ncbi:type II toxin-antitoxin system VapC family toxin [uncultured Sphingomonas sp.]|uniref:type II toxin-antitoxin system VapC family toxin n=1 Tax=uncultured Sphingomonas sp. TaxID=158754 RepID=UPI0035CC66F0
MIVDSSAIVAILLREVERRNIADALASASTAKISAGSWIELGAVAVRRQLTILSSDRLDAVRREFGITIEPVTAQQAIIGHEAYRTFGIGSGHRAQLNFGDCFAYALAKATGEPLLFKGDDFTHTDITPALPPS